MPVYLDFNASSPMHAPVIAAPPAGCKSRELSASGGDQENHHRGGTENVAGIVGPGMAAKLARLEIERRQLHLVLLRDLFELRRAAAAWRVM